MSYFSDSLNGSSIRWIPWQFLFKRRMPFRKTFVMVLGIQGESSQIFSNREKSKTRKNTNPFLVDLGNLWQENLQGMSFPVLELWKRQRISLKISERFPKSKTRKKNLEDFPVVGTSKVKHQGEKVLLTNCAFEKNQCWHRHMQQRGLCCFSLFPVTPNYTRAVHVLMPINTIARNLHSIVALTRFL